MRRYHIYLKLKSILNNYYNQLFQISLIKVGFLIIGIITPFLFKILVDDVMIGKRVDLLLKISLGYLILYIIESIFMFCEIRNKNKFYNNFLFDIRIKIFKQYLEMNDLFFKNNNIGELVNRLDNDVEYFEKYIDQHLINYLYLLVFSFVNISLMILIYWKLAVFSILMIPFSFWMTKWLGKSSKEKSTAYRKIWGKYENWIREIISLWKEIKVFNLEKKQLMFFSNYWKRMSRLFFKRQIYWYSSSLFQAIKDFFVTRMNIYFIGGCLIINGQLSIGALIVFMKFFEKLLVFVSEINKLEIELSNEEPFLEKVLDIIELSNKKDNIKLEKFYICDGEIEFKDVTFEYEDTLNRVFNGFSMKINKNETVAIIGESGKGKSTLIKLILGIIDPDKGKVLIDGQNIKEINKKDYRKHIGVIMQNSRLFNLSIKENLLLANSKAEIKDIEYACEKANILEFIKSLPENFDTIIGEKGMNLSGGQRQRIILARTLLLNPQILIFDEATSALDYESEKIINETIEKIRHEKTIIIIAHRKSSLKVVDRLINL